MIALPIRTCLNKSTYTHHPTSETRTPLEKIGKPVITLVVRSHRNLSFFSATPLVTPRSLSTRQIPNNGRSRFSHIRQHNIHPYNTYVRAELHGESSAARGGGRKREGSGIKAYHCRIHTIVAWRIKHGRCMSNFPSRGISLFRSDASN